MEKRVDLFQSKGTFAGDRRDAKGQKAEQVSSSLARGTRRNEIRTNVDIRNCSSKIRERVEHDLGLSGLPREKLLATIVRLMEVTLIRVGKEEYARENHSYGYSFISAEFWPVGGRRY
jgi:DNA topoisomerase-1